MEKQAPPPKKECLSSCKCDRKTFQCVNQGRKVTQFIFKEIALTNLRGAIMLEFSCVGTLVCWIPSFSGFRSLFWCYKFSIVFFLKVQGRFCRQYLSENIFSLYCWLTFFSWYRILSWTSFSLILKTLLRYQISFQ